MAKLYNQITIDASPEQVWSVLANIEELEKYDPVVARSSAISENKSGIGAMRRCDVRPKGFFKEKVVQWQPYDALAFELIECTLPVHSSKHSYTLQAENGKTHVSQVMEYKMKMGLVGHLMDLLMVRKKWDAGIKQFFVGLKQHVESKP